MQNLLVATTNPGKLPELRALTADLPVQWLTLADVGLDKIIVEETGDTFVANAMIKAEAYSRASGLPTLADDSGLVIDALNGEPGVLSARYAPTTEERNAKVLKNLEGIAADNRTARFVAVIALTIPDQVTIISEGWVEGHIASAPRGTNGFGYDPIFLVDQNRTMAELSADEKNAISHRGRALAKMRPVLGKLFGS